MLFPHGPTVRKIIGELILGLFSPLEIPNILLKHAFLFARSFLARLPKPTLVVTNKYMEPAEARRWLCREIHAQFAHHNIYHSAFESNALIDTRDLEQTTLHDLTTIQLTC